MSRLVHGAAACLVPGSIVTPIAPISRWLLLGSIAPPLSCRSGRIVAARSSSAPLPSGRGGRIVAVAELTLVAGEPAVGHPGRSRRVGAEPLYLVFPIGAEVALEPEPLGLVVVVALPGQDVRAGAVQEPAIVRNHHRAAGEFHQRVLQRAQCFD